MPPPRGAWAAGTGRLRNVCLDPLNSVPVIGRSFKEHSDGAQYLLRVDLVVELQDVKDPVLDALQGQGGSVAVQAARLCDPAGDLRHGRGQAVSTEWTRGQCPGPSSTKPSGPQRQGLI